MYSNNNIFSTINMANPYRTHFSGRKYSSQEREQACDAIQKNPSNMYTLGPLKCVLIMGMSSFHGCPLRGVPL